MSTRYPKFAKGDVVRFTEGGTVDWEVELAQPHLVKTGIQVIHLRSGMTGRRMTTTNQYIIHRSEVVK